MVPDSLPIQAATSPADALRLLREGNARFVAGTPRHEALTPRRLELVAGQRPFAVVLGCSDSRVPIETVFDQVPGHIFAVRLAGNFVNDDVLATIEYGVAVLSAPLVLVLGHGSCGCITAAVDYVRDGTHQPGYISNLIHAVEPSVRLARPRDERDWIEAAVERNVVDTVATIGARSGLVAAGAATGSISIRGAVYELRSGTVRFLESSM